MSAGCRSEKRRVDGQGQLDLGKVNKAHLKILLEQYERRLAESESAYNHLETKARWVLSVAVPLGMAVVGAVVFKELRFPDTVMAPLMSMAVLLSIGSVLAVVSVSLREYKGGALTTTVPSKFEEQASDFLTGDTDESSNEFSIKRLRGLGDAIETNEGSNRLKGCWLGWSIGATVMSLPLASILLVVGVC